MEATIIFTVTNFLIGFVIFIALIIGMYQECNDNTSFTGIPSGIFIAVIFAWLLMLSLLIFGTLEQNNIIYLNVHHENWLFDLF